MKHPTFLIIFFIFFISLNKLFSKAPEEESDKIKPPKVGNFMVATSQQPGPLISFGQNVLENKEMQTYFFLTRVKGDESEALAFLPSILFGIKDIFSLFFVVPYFEQQKAGPYKSKGIGDIITQLEYFFYTKDTYTSEFIGTLVTNLTWPTGSSKKNPPTGFGAPSFFLGFTANYQSLYWYIFTSNGFSIPGKHHGTKFGNQFLYQCGFEAVIGNLPGWVFACQLELDGIYSQRNKMSGLTDKNSGGNVILATPSLWISSERFLLQFGPSFPLYQKYHGIQDKIRHAFTLSTAWKFTF